jgi:hypothetical protein
MKTSYEWVAETVDEVGDIIDCNFQEKLCDLRLEPGDELALVRRTGSEEDGEVDRWYAYAKDNMVLPLYFQDNLGEPTNYIVPAKYRKELEKYLSKKLDLG